MLTITLCITAVAVGIFIYSIFLPRILGRQGERIVLSNMCSLPKSEYAILPDLLLQGQNGTSQIDFVVVSIYGVFVMEVKNYQGLITGDEHEQRWQKMSKGERTVILSPLRQNESHIRTLRRVCPMLAKVPVYSVVVFNPKARLNIKSDSSYIINWNELPDFFSFFDKKTIFESDVLKIVKMLREANIVAPGARKVHREYVEQVVKAARDAEFPQPCGECPKCGHPLVRVRGRYGIYACCSNRPECDYSEPLEYELEETLKEKTV